MNSRKRIQLIRFSMMTSILLIQLLFAVYGNSIEPRTSTSISQEPSFQDYYLLNTTIDYLSGKPDGYRSIPLQIVTTHDNNYVILFDASESDFMGYDLISHQYAVCMKLSSNGTLIWEKKLFNYDIILPNQELIQITPRSITPTNDGGFLLAGDQQTSYIEDYDIVYSSPYKAYIAKFDLNGEIEWDAIIDPLKEETSIGWVMSSVVDLEGNIYSVIDYSYNSGGGEIRIQKRYNNGTAIWDVTVHNDIVLDRSIGDTFVLTKDNSLLLIYAVTNNSRHIWLIEAWNLDGVLLWRNQVGEEERYDDLFIHRDKIDYDNNDSVILSGGTEGPGSSYIQNCLLLKISVEGEIMWETIFTSIASGSERDCYYRNAIHSTNQNTQERRFLALEHVRINPSIDRRAGWLINFNAKGEHQWDGLLIPYSDQSLNYDPISILEMEDGNYLVLGEVYYLNGNRLGLSLIIFSNDIMYDANSYFQLVSKYPDRSIDRPPDLFKNPLAWLFSALIIISLLIGVVRLRKGSIITPSSTTKISKKLRNGITDDITTDQSDISVEGINNDLVVYRYIEGIGSVRVCCYQTARLREQYCGCGRSIEQKLLDYFES